MHRAYAQVAVRSVDDGRGGTTITGVATTPSTDRMGDIVESTGAQYSLPVPFLLHHDARLPVGTVEHLDTSSRGIRFRARLADVRTPGAVKDRVDEARDSIAHGLLRAVSIGFRPLASEPIDRGDPYGPQRYKSWELLEISAVAIPANQDATIDVIKRFASRSTPARRGGGAIKLIGHHERSPAMKAATRGGLRIIRCRRFSGVAMSGAQSSHGHAIVPDGVRYRLPIPLLLDHDWNKHIGWIHTWEWRGGLAHVTGEVASHVAGGATADDAWRRIHLGMLRGLSIRMGKDFESKYDGTLRGTVYTKCTIVEVSIAIVGANPDARILEFADDETVTA
jgi:HK97 family phage prohead protease